MTEKGRLLFVLAILYIHTVQIHGINVTVGFQRRNTMELEEITTCRQWQCKNLPVYNFNREQYFSAMGCFCDDLCEGFNDCCPDVDVTQKQINTNILSKVQCTFNCVVSPFTYFLSVMSCPDDYPDQEVAELCSGSNTSDPFLQIPATGKMSGLMYRNIYCARCHEEEAAMWASHINCYDDQAFNFTDVTHINEILANDKCHFSKYGKPSDVPYLRACQENIITSCPDAQADINQKCEATGYQLVYTENDVYKNIKCAQCNNQTVRACMNYLRSSCTKAVYKTSYKHVFNIRYNITSGGGQYTHGFVYNLTSFEFKRENPCTHGEIFDPFSESCRLSGYYGYGQNIMRERTDHADLSGPVTGKNVTTDNSETDKRDIRAKTFGNFMVWNFSTMVGTLSSTGAIVSLTLILLTILLYSIFKPLRTIQGYNILSLLVALFTGDLLMLISPYVQDYPRQCKLLGIGVHYLPLVAFFWLNVLAVDAWLRYIASKYIKKVKAKIVLIYSLYAWFLPLSPVIIAINLDLLHPSHPYSPDYGNGVCWMGNNRAIVAFYAVPLAVVFLINVVLISSTAAKICLVNESPDPISGFELRRQFIDCVKLSVVMSVTRVFLILSALVPHPMITYTYILSNVIQGVFIGQNFVCNHKVWCMLKEKIIQRENSNRCHFEQQDPRQITHM